MILKSWVISLALLFTISSRYYYFIDCLLDNLNSNLLFNLSEGYITMESACFTCITTCLQYTSIMYNYMRMSRSSRRDYYCFIRVMFHLLWTLFLFQWCLKTKGYIGKIQMVLVIIILFFVECYRQYCNKSYPCWYCS